MTIINLKFRNTEISLNCEDEDRLKLLATRLNKRVSEIADGFKNTSDLKLFIIAGLMLEDQLDNLLKKIDKDSQGSKNEVLEVKKAFNDTVLQIADYIDNIANKVEKS